MTPLEAALAALGYPPGWRDSPLLDAALVLAQHQALQLPGADRNLEHYRYAAYLEVLDRVKSPAQADHLVALLAEDPYPGMASAAFGILLERAPDADFHRLATHPLAEPLAGKIRRQTLLRLLEREGPTPEVLARCLAEGDGQVHRHLLDLELPRGIVERLAEEGANRAIRNLAAQRLRRRD